MKRSNERGKHASLTFDESEKNLIKKNICRINQLYQRKAKREMKALVGVKRVLDYTTAKVINNSS